MPTDCKDEGGLCASPPRPDEPQSTDVVLTRESFASPGAFQRTHWTVVMAAAQGGSAEAVIALERLCTTYWRPLYAYVRRDGKQHHDAQDLVQGFLCQLIARNSLASVDQTKGKFRSFLLAAMKNFLINDARERNTQKHGGDCIKVPIDVESADEQYLQIASATKTPDQVFDQQWAVTFLGQVVDRLRAEFVSKGNAELFEAIKIFLTGEKHAASYRDLALRLGTTEDALKMAVNRMRKRYRALLEEEMAKFSNPEDVDEELRSIIAALS